MRNAITSSGRVGHRLHFAIEASIQSFVAMQASKTNDFPDQSKVEHCSHSGSSFACISQLTPCHAGIKNKIIFENVGHPSKTSFKLFIAEQASENVGHRSHFASHPLGAPG